MSWEDIRLQDALAMAVVKKPEKKDIANKQASGSAAPTKAAGAAPRLAAAATAEPKADEDEEAEDNDESEQAGPTRITDLLEIARQWADRKNARPGTLFYVPSNFADLDYGKRRDFARQVLRFVAQAELGAFLLSLTPDSLLNVIE
jgi:hypothetical protein